MTSGRAGAPYREPVPSRSRIFDAALAVAVTAVGLAEVWVPFSSVQGDGSRWTASLVVVLLGPPLALRRVRPLAVALVVLWTWPVVYSITTTLILFWGQFVPMGVALFSVARYGRGREPAYGAAAGALTLLFIDLRVPLMQSPGEITFHWGVFTLVWLAGWGLRRLADRAAASLQRAVDVEVAATERTMAAILEERTRIARELHDVVAHAVSVIVVQAGAAEQVVDDDPEFVRTALRTVRSTGTEALAEMRRVVAILRETEDPAALQPPPGVGSLQALVDEARTGGLAAELVVAGRSRPLPAGLDVAAYRIVQEALTNVRRHAAASSVRVLLTYEEDAVHIEVVDDGVGPAGSSSGGHGLIGMRERAALYGGRLETSSGAGSGFTVRAVLPVAPA
jgi:signal transduction histidine kinase